MKWACILLPQLALDGVLRHRPECTEPLVLLGGTPQRRVLRAVNARARALGLAPGLTLAAAQTLCPGFATAEYDLDDIERNQNLLAAWAYGFSAQVSLHYPRALLLEVESSMPLFGPWPAFSRRLRDELAALGFSHRITLAPNPVSARIMANVSDDLVIANDTELRQRLGPLPLDRAGLDNALVQSLGRMGLIRLRQVMDLPRAEIARRFPAGLLNQLDLLLGRRPLALGFYRPPDTFDARVEFNSEVESNQQLLFPLRRLTLDLAMYLAGRDSGVQRFMLYLEHRAQPDSLITVGLLTPERDAGLLFEYARGRLEIHQVTAPILALRLVAEQLPAFVPEHRSLFEPRPQQTLSWEQLRERLRTRLGDSAVYAVGGQGDHRPEASWRQDARSCDLQMLAQGKRPAWLLREPIPLGEAAPRILAGPERIESGWWDGSDIRRDYYLVELPNGRLAWAYQAIAQRPGWWLHGWFA